MSIAPIVLFVYNRPKHTKITLESIKNARGASHHKLIIFSDGPKNNEDKIKIDEVREIIHSENWTDDVEIKLSVENLGLAKSIERGVSKVVNIYGSIIVFEDDMIVSEGAIEYFDKALQLYQNDTDVMHISGYMHPVEGNLPETYFLPVTSCWGWATWKRAWSYYDPVIDNYINDFTSKKIQKFNLNSTYDHYAQLLKNMDGEIKTWAVKWYASIFFKNGLALHPKRSLIRNIGHDETGINCTTNSILLEQDIVERIDVKRVKKKVSFKAMVALERYYRGYHKGYKKIIARLLNVI